MRVFTGKSVFSGIAFGSVFLLQRPEGEMDTGRAADPAAEWQRFEAAKKDADVQLGALYEKTKAELSEQEADIIDVQRMMLDDGDFNDAVQGFINDDGNKAAWAVQRAGQHFAEFFASLDDEYMKGRATDVRDLATRLVGILMGQRTSLVMTKPSIVVADDLTPSETLQMDKSKIRAFVTRRGSTSSHTAILARILNIPSVVQADIPLTADINGMPAAVDGHKGVVYLDPDDATIDELNARHIEDEKRHQLQNAVRGLPTITKDGQRVKLFANIGSVEDMEAALAGDAEGVGLFRSEFLYLGRSDYPSEEVQFEAYRKVAEGMGGREVIIRTCDIGADKKVDYFQLAEEENPALGYRAIRICFDRPDMFKAQLRAIYRASAFGSVAIMFPMITSLWEVRRCKQFAAEARLELEEKGVAIGNVPLGIMIETPAAVMVADTLAKEVDFFSVGTNDLTQYTLAVDRQNEKLDPFLDTRHPAVLKMLEMVAKSAHDNGIWAGICGELAADPALTETFLEMGFDELSMSPVFILELRGRIREMDFGNR